jgi:RHS repeat-associated protein
VSSVTTAGREWSSSFSYRASGGAGANTFTWTPGLSSAGRYRVYARWTQHADRASNAPFTVHHAGGATTVRVDQRQSGGIWVPLGGFELAPGQNHRVALSDAAAGSYVVADAVRFVRDTARRAVMADAVRFAAPRRPDFTAPSATLAREYVYLGGRPLALIEAGAVHWVHTDHLGTPQKLTDAAGQVVWDAVLRPFGEAHAITGPAALNPRFPGQLFDPETGFHYNYFRDYDPSTGRYIQSDPIGLAAGDLNLYRYVFNNPVNSVDPYGLDTLLLGVGGSLAFRGGVEGSAGIAVNVDNPASPAIGGFTSAAVAGGLNVSGDVFVGIIRGPFTNLCGESFNTNIVIGPPSITAIFDLGSGDFWAAQ